MSHFYAQIDTATGAVFSVTQLAEAIEAADLVAIESLDNALIGQRWRADLAQHIEIENTRLLPHVPPGARWAARVYLVEHDRIALLADEYLLKVRAMAQQPPQGEQARRAAVLGLLDAAHALRHVLEHHHER